MNKEDHNFYIKILKKEKDGILCYFPGVGKKKTSWEEFNQIYEIDPNDKFKAYLKSEWKEKHAKAKECYDQAMVYFMMNNGASGKDTEKAIINNMVVMDQVKKAAEIMGIPEGQSMKIFSELLHRTLGGFVNQGIGISGEVQNMLSDKQKRKNAYNKVKIETEKAEAETKKKVEKEDRETYSYRPFANFGYLNRSLI